MVKYVNLYTCNDKLIVLSSDITNKWVIYKSIKINSSSEQSNDGISKWMNTLLIRMVVGENAFIDQ